MLKAIENAVRERKFHIGRFAVDGAGCGRAKRWWQATLPGARDTPFPASYNDLVPGRSTNDTSGTYGIKPRRGCHAAWIRRDVTKEESTLHLRHLSPHLFLTTNLQCN
jgi:beta-glucuronidase